MENIKKIRVGICGYGNLGKGVEIGIKNNPDMELVAVFTRRNPEELKTLSGIKIVSMKDLPLWQSHIDVMILCGGSAKDLPSQTPEIAKMYNTVDSFDTHSNIPAYYETAYKVAKENKKVSIISVGWDPGLFSLQRLLSESTLPIGNTYTFWGKGVSQGHSDAIRKISGVKNAIQYTIPIESTIESIRNGENPELTTRQKHIRECFVVIEEGENKERIENEIKTMPNYFADYDTIVHFISEEELKKEHSKMAHGGIVMRSGNTSKENKQMMEFSLKLDSNPEFTSSILIAYARAAYRLSIQNDFGAKTIFDIPLYMLSTKSREDLIKQLL